MSREWYGSLQNRLAEKSAQPKPEVGMGATELYYTDREAYEVIAVKDDRHITVRRLTAVRADRNGCSEIQEYVYISNPENITKTLFLTKKGEWRERYGRSLGCNRFRIGVAEEYYDYSF